MVSRSLAIASFAALLAFSTPLSVNAAEEVLDGVAAVVNDDVITFSEVRELVGARELTLRESYHGDELAKRVKELRLNAINELIDRQLVLQDFKKNKYSIPDYIVDDHVNSVIREQFQGDRQAFIRTLLAQGFTMPQFRKMETDKMIVQAMRQRSVKVSPVLSPTKVEEYYHKHIADYSTPDQVKLRMIVIHKDAADAKKTADEIRQKVKDGGDFAKLAELYTDDASDKSTGGDRGWIDRKTFDEHLSDPAFKLKAGQVSSIIDFSGSYYLLYVEARKNGEVKPLNAVRSDVEDKVLQEQRIEAQQKWIASLRAKAYVKVY